MLRSPGLDWGLRRGVVTRTHEARISQVEPSLGPVGVAAEADQAAGAEHWFEIGEDDSTGAGLRHPRPRHSGYRTGGDDSIERCVVGISSTRCPSRTSRVSSIRVISPGILDDDRDVMSCGASTKAVISAVLE